MEELAVDVDAQQVSQRCCGCAAGVEGFAAEWSSMEEFISVKLRPLLL